MRLRRVNKQLNHVVEERLQSQIYLDVVKCDLLDVMREDEQSGTNDVYPHRRHNLLINISDRSITLFVADHWTSRDVSCLYRCVAFFAKYARCITIDAAIAELIVVGLSTMKLSRWHAFETYVQAVGPIVANELHMKVTKSPQPIPIPFFPLATEITIRALTSDLSHLSRLPDYGVSVRRLFNESTLELLRINIVDTASASRYEVGSACRHIKRPHKHMNTFKKWVHAAELREKYVQQYS
uniref:Cyclin_C domain-containing protein n=1 Tax=Panagrellus redivivus TaxID=6233 RepID=A0A7E4V6S4_PANRE